MPVRSRGRLHVPMPQQALHAVRIDAFAQEQRGRGVAPVVEAHRPHLRGGPELHPAARARAEVPIGLALAVRLSSAFAAAAGVDPVVDEAGARECVHNCLRVSFLGAHSSVRAGAASPRGPTHGQVPQLIYRLALA